MLMTTVLTVCMAQCGTDTGWEMCMNPLHLWSLHGKVNPRDMWECGQGHLSQRACFNIQADSPMFWLMPAEKAEVCPPYQWNPVAQLRFQLQNDVFVLQHVPWWKCRTPLGGYLFFTELLRQAFLMALGFLHNSSENSGRHSGFWHICGNFCFTSRESGFSLAGFVFGVVSKIHPQNV